MNVTIVDESSCSIICTLWGEICSKTKLNLGDIIGISGARVADYGGKSLNAAMDHADLVVNPNHERARKLASWYNDLIGRHGSSAINRIKSLSQGDFSKLNLESRGGGSDRLQQQGGVGSSKKS